MANRKKTKKKQTAVLSCLTRTKSTIHSACDAMFYFYSKFCEETSLHGLKHTVAGHLHFFERLLWFVLTVAAFGGAVYCGLAQLGRYNSEPVVVSLQRDYRAWWTAYPAVTVCFMNRMEEKKVRAAIITHWNITEDSDSEKYEYYYGFVELIAEVSFRTNLQNFWKYQSDDTVNGIDLLQLALDVHPETKLKVLSHSHEPLYWTPVMTEEGVCMTSNSDYKNYQSVMSQQSWEKEKLMQCHYHNDECYLKIDTSDRAVRYFIHSPFDIATAISNPTGEVLPGEELIIDYKAVEIQAAPRVKNLRPEQRRCRYPDEWLSDAIRAYSFSLCQMECRNRMALMFCGCRPFMHVKGGV